METSLFIVAKRAGQLTRQDLRRAVGALRLMVLAVAATVLARAATV